MLDYSREEAAQRAGINVDDLSQLVDLGILTPSGSDRFSVGDIRKAGMAHSMAAAGMPLEALGSAIRDGMLSLNFLDHPVYGRFTALTDETFAAMSQRTGIPVETLLTIRESVGGALPTPEDRVREGELVIVRFVELTMTEGFRPEVTERLIRAFGDSARRIADAESEWWVSEVFAPRLAAGQSAADVGEYDSSGELSDLTEEAFLAMYHAQQTHAWTSKIIEGFEQALAESGLYIPLERPPAMCFFDIAGYTRLTAERGDQAAVQLANDFSRLVQRSSAQHGGRPVKWLGDGVMLFFPDPGLGVEAALDMADGVTDAGLPPAHVGLHAGPVILQAGDYYGQTVNIASRIAEYARPGEVLVSQAVVDASDAAPIAFTDIGDVELKGVTGAVHLHAARRG